MISMVQKDARLASKKAPRKPVTVRLEPAAHERLRHIAEDRRIPLSIQKVAEFILLDFLEQAARNPKVLDRLGSPLSSAEGNEQV